MLTSSQKVFDVLEFLCANGPHKALEVSKALSLQKSSVHRFLNSLIEFGYVRKDDQTGLFSVTLKVVQLGAMVSSKIDMVETPPIARGSARLSSRRKAKRKSTNTSPPSRGRPTPCIP